MTSRTGPSTRGGGATTHDGDAGTDGGGATGGVAADSDEAIGFVMRLGEALHAHGTPAHRLEEALARLCDRLGLDGQFFSTPTFLLASFERGGVRAMRIVRIEASEVDLGKMAELDDVAGEVVRGRATAAWGASAVEAVVRRPPMYGRLATGAATALASAAAARFFGGGPREMAVALVVGALVAGLAELLGRVPAAGRVYEAVAAFAGVVLAALCATAWPPVLLPIATLGGLIVLFPGLTLTVAMTELATRNLVSGTARLAGALLVFLSITFGVALGSGAAGVFAAPGIVQPPGSPSLVLPGWTEWAALAVAAVSFSVLFRVRRGDLPASIAGCLVAYGGARSGAFWLGPELGTFLGALAVGAMANLYARWLRRPAGVLLVPGIMLLVPGSVGFRSLTSLMARDVVSGIELGFAMVMIAVSLVAGLLFANALVPPRRAL